MKNKLFLLILILFLALGISVSVSAEEEVNVYNNNEEIALAYEPILCDGEYYIHLDDLALLGLDVVKEESKYTISLNDCLGYVKKLILTPGEYVEIAPGILVPVDGNSSDISMSTDENSDGVEKIYAGVRWVARSKSVIGKAYDKNLPIVPGVVIEPIPGIATTSTTKESNTKFLSGDSQLALEEDYDFGIIETTKRMPEIVKSDDEFYVLAKLIGDNFAQNYSSGNGRIDFSVHNNDNVVTKTTINLVYNTVAPREGHSVNVYTAYKTGVGSTIDDFEILSSVSCVILENESSISLEIETPAEKIRDKNIYFIADLGERYELAYNEYDFSGVGEVLVY